MSAAIDYNSLPVRFPQFDADRPITLLEALRDGDEGAAAAFADWMADDEQRDELHDLLSYFADSEVVQGLATMWAEEAV